MQVTHTEDKTGSARGESFGKKRVKYMEKRALANSFGRLAISKASLEDVSFFKEIVNPSFIFRWVDEFVSRKALDARKRGNATLSV